MAVVGERDPDRLHVGETNTSWVIWSGKRLIGRVDDGLGKEAMVARAALISAAPDLNEACEAALDWFEAYPDSRENAEGLPIQDLRDALTGLNWGVKQPIANVVTVSGADEAALALMDAALDLHKACQAALGWFETYASCGDNPEDPPIQDLRDALASARFGEDGGPG